MAIYKQLLKDTKESCCRRKKIKWFKKHQYFQRRRGHTDITIGILLGTPCTNLVIQICKRFIWVAWQDIWQKKKKSQKVLIITPKTVRRLGIKNKYELIISKFRLEIKRVSSQQNTAFQFTCRKMEEHITSLQVDLHWVTDRQTDVVPGTASHSS